MTPKTLVKFAIPGLALIAGFLLSEVTSVQPKFPVPPPPGASFWACRVVDTKMDCIPMDYFLQSITQDSKESGVDL